MIIIGVGSGELHPVGILFFIDLQSKSARDVELPNINVVSTLLCRRSNNVGDRRFFDVESTSYCVVISRVDFVDVLTTS